MEGLAKVGDGLVAEVVVGLEVEGEAKAEGEVVRRQWCQSIADGVS